MFCEQYVNYIHIYIILCYYDFGVIIVARPKTKTSAQSTNEYAKRNYDRLAINIRKGAKEAIRVHAEKRGTTIQGYIKGLISADMDGIEL